ncbi:MAG: M15 family metallopeptidase [Lachnospiraceae bacterium]|nr:M15 family metallopeptidase [Lachnospiraceae bacterium]
MRTIVAEGFYYEPIPQTIRERMQGVSYPDDINENKVNYDCLRYLRLKYIDFNGNEAVGEMVCNVAIASDVTEIFHELYLHEYQIESIRLIDDFDADDTASMLANNTSCFCYRTVENSNSLSNHAYGRAIDLNPFYNPYIIYGKGENGTDYISPKESEIYVDRTQDFPHKIDEDDLACKLFKQHGFKWGGNWSTQKDYQHFEKKG